MRKKKKKKINEEKERKRKLEQEKIAQKIRDYKERQLIFIRI